MYLKDISHSMLSGGSRVVGPRQGWKEGISDDVIALSQRWYYFLIKWRMGICGPKKDTLLRLRHGWHC